MLTYLLQHFKNNGTVPVSFVNQLLRRSIAHHLQLPNIVRVYRSNEHPSVDTPVDAVAVDAVAVDAVAADAVAVDAVAEDGSPLPPVGGRHSNGSSNGTVWVVGDVHGQYMDFAQIFQPALGELDGWMFMDGWHCCHVMLYSISTLHHHGIMMQCISTSPLLPYRWSTQ